MIRSSIEKDFTPKKEGETNDGKNPQEPSSSRTWSALRDPRIVRVSRSLGGKDRHSKVRTIKGLRDRRIRLSAPTAIQLYDLQERLGLNQPSKVIDWLLNAAQHAIDELPPLQMPTENYVQDSQPMAMSHEVIAQPNIKSRNDMFGTDQITWPKSMYWNSHEPLRAKFKDVARETVVEKSDWMKRTEQENQEPIEDHSAEKWDHSSLPRSSHSFFAGSLNNIAVPYTSYYHSGLPSTAPVSHLEADGSSSQTEDLYNCATIPLPSSFAPPSGSQLLFYPSGTTPSIIPTYIAPPNDFDPKQITSFQMLSSSSQNLQPNYMTTRATQLSIAPSQHYSLNNHVSQSNAFGDRHQQS